MAVDNHDEWWTTPFPHKISILTDDMQPARLWLIENGYTEWQQWNTLLQGKRVLFEFLHKEDAMLFALRWL